VRTRGKTSGVAIVLICVASWLLCGCGANAGAAAAPTATATPIPVVLVKVKTMTIARKHIQVLADLKGMTLYYFKPDTGTSVACTGSCSDLWPPLTLAAGAPAAATALPGRFGEVTSARRTQVTYNGHPLYTYAKDRDAGDAYGQGIGRQWYVATPDLALQS
jgi:predicted lipoprotein with Yx(FWY)xxD motif